MNKKIINIVRFLCVLMTICVCAPLQGHGQTTIAPFKIRLVNGEGYTYKQLPKNKTVVLIYFSPTCDNCKVFTSFLMKNKSVLKNKLVVMISYEDIKEVKNFDNDFHLSSQQNIKIGSEGYTFVVQKYYQIEHFPFLVIYDKNGLQEKMIRNEESPQKLIRELSMIK